MAHFLKKNWKRVLLLWLKCCDIQIGLPPIGMYTLFTTGQVPAAYDAVFVKESKKLAAVSTVAGFLLNDIVLYFAGIITIFLNSMG